jgi:hypothetical protein
LTSTEEAGGGLREKAWNVEEIEQNCIYEPYNHGKVALKPEEAHAKQEELRKKKEWVPLVVAEPYEKVVEQARQLAQKRIEKEALEDHIRIEIEGIKKEFKHKGWKEKDYREQALINLEDTVPYEITVFANGLLGVLGEGEKEKEQ